MSNPSLEEVIDEPVVLETGEETTDDTPVEVVVEESMPEPERPVFDQAAIEAQEDEDAKDIEKYPRPIKKRFETLTYHVRERERQIAEEKQLNDSLLQYGNGAKSVIETLAKENIELRKALQREALASREAMLASSQSEFLAAREAADATKEVAASQRIAELAQAKAQIQQYQMPEAYQPPPPPQRQASTGPITDPRTADWLQKNKWFAEDRVMRNHAATYSVTLAEQGVAPESETYYNRIDAEMRKRFPESFETGAMPESAKPQPAAQTQRRPPVATASRTNGATNGTRKVVLSASQAAAAKKLGVPLNEYAKYVHLVKE